MRYSESAAAAYRIARLPTTEERHAALAEIPVEFQSLVRATAICIREVPRHWLAGVRDGRIAPADVPPVVREAIEEFFPGALPHQK